jgi:glycosyltransferase involved in cell wall biosynthesis
MTGRAPITVTVVIPCFNQARFLPAAVSSVRAQHHPSVDCIVVNDGSTDDTATVAAALGVRVIEQANAGVSAARNAGLAATAGEIVIFLDADDELLPQAASLAVAALEAAPEAAAVVGRCQVIDEEGSPQPADHRPIDTSRLYEEWLSGNFVWAPAAAAFRTQALQEAGGFPEGLGPAADYAVYLRLARSGAVRVITSEVARYRRHDESMSRDPALMLRATLSVLRREIREAPVSLRRAIGAGRRCWCDWYGEQIVSRIRSDLHAGTVSSSTIRAGVTLVRHCPRVALRHVKHKGRLFFTAARAGRHRRAGARKAS